MVQTRQERRIEKGKAVAQEETIVGTATRGKGQRGGRGRDRGRGRGRGRVGVRDRVMHEDIPAAIEQERVLEQGEPNRPMQAARDVRGGEGENGTSRVTENMQSSTLEQLLRSQQQMVQQHQQYQEQMVQMLWQMMPPPQDQQNRDPEPVQQTQVPTSTQPERVPLMQPVQVAVPAPVQIAMAPTREELESRSEFMKQKPPTFKGDTDPEAAINWIEELETIFAFLGCTDARKVQYAVYMLRGEASRWWRSIQRLLDVVHHPLTWIDFTRVFLEQYFPDSVRDLKVAEFVNLRQGNMTVAEYEAKFHSLSLFAPDLVANPWEKG